MYKNRLKKIKGQIEGIERMIDQNRDCMDVVQQIVAARSALSKVGIEILKDEANSCISKTRKQKQLYKIIDKLFKIS